MSAQLAIQFIRPQNGQILNNGPSLQVSAYVTLSCGAPTCAGGRYDASQFSVTAELFREGLRLSASDMSFTGDVSEFACEIALSGPGRYELIISALDRNSGMAGRARCSFGVRS